MSISSASRTLATSLALPIEFSVTVDARSLSTLCLFQESEFLPPILPISPPGCLKRSQQMVSKGRAIWLYKREPYSPPLQEQGLRCNYIAPQRLVDGFGNRLTKSKVFIRLRQVKTSLHVLQFLQLRIAPNPLQAFAHGV